MAWESCSSDVLVRYTVNVPSEFNSVLQIAYRLYSDSEASEPTVRIDMSYVHIMVEKLSYKSDASTGTVYQSVLMSPFIGSTELAFDPSQHSLNEDRDENGNYRHPFSWPYVQQSDVIKTSPGDSNTQASCVSQYAFNSSPMFGVCFPTYEQGITQSSVLFFGTMFSDMSQFSGNNSNGQPKILVQGNSLHVASSALRSKSSSSVLSYDDDISKSVDDLEVVSPFYDSQALSSFQISESQMSSYGLLRYDPQHFETDDTYDPYVIKASTSVACPWYTLSSNDVQNESGSQSFKVCRLSNVQEQELVYREFSIPEYPLPDPVGQIKDDSVFRLQRTYDSHGNPITDQNGYPILQWIKCERMGREE